MAIQRRLVEAVEVTESQIHLIRLKGIFDASTVSEFEKVVSYLLTRNFFKMVVDLSRVEFISSAGWGAFTAELRRVRENDGDITLAGMNSDLFDVFLLLELDHFISAFDTEDEAITAFLRPAVLPEPEVKLENVAPPMMETPRVAPVAEAAETRPPTIFEMPGPSGALIEYPRENGISSREAYTVEEETFATASATSTLAPYNESDFVEQENEISDETLEIEANLPLASSGPEMYELLLTSGRPALDPVISRRALPPPSLSALPGKIPDSDIADFPAEKFYQGEAGTEAEFGFYEHEPIAEENQHEETQEFTEAIATSDLDFSGHEPISEETPVENGFSEAMSAPDRAFSSFVPTNFSRQDAEAFSELSLDLERHLQAHGGMDDSPNTEQELHPYNDENGNGFTIRDHEHETQEIEASAFGASPDYSTSAEAGEGLAAEFSQSVNSDADFSAPAPAFENDATAEDLAAPRFAFGATDFSANTFATAYNSLREHDDDFETQDIRDPWILEEIDSLPEEYEMDGAGVEDDERPIAAAQFMAVDFEADYEPLTLAPVSEPAEAPVNTADNPAPPFEPSAEPEFFIFGDEADETTIAVNATNSDERASATTAIFNAAVAPLPMRAEPAARSRKKRREAAPKAKKTKSRRDDDSAVTAEAPEIAMVEESVDNLPVEAEPELMAQPVLAPMDETDLPKIPMSDDIGEMIRGIIAAYPHFGPAMICKFLEERVTPPVFLSRSTVYRYLRDAKLNTVAQRREFAGYGFD
ncbi:MAG: hypothetical protein ALAOOOJD_03561 [bacterium]|nr:hypothetical protein [bacterium]